MQPSGAGVWQGAGKSRTKKGQKHKEFGQKPPPPGPPQRTPDPANSLCLGPLFPSKYSKKAYIKNFERGGLGGPKILYAEFLRVLFWHLKRGISKYAVADGKFFEN